MAKNRRLLSAVFQMVRVTGLEPAGVPTLRVALPRGGGLHGGCAAQEAAGSSGFCKKRKRLQLMQTFSMVRVTGLEPAAS